MKTHIEIEKKVMLTEEQYLRCQSLLPFTKTVTQTNHYYDARRKNVSLRIREIDGHYLFTCKSKTAKGCIEHEMTLTECSLQSAPIQALLQELNIPAPNEKVGQLTTIRSTFKDGIGEFCLDKNLFTDGSVDYELEYELLENEKADLTLFHSYLKQCGIEWIENKISKVQRCLAKERKTQMKIAIFCAQGFEECEALVTVDCLRRAGLDVKLVSTEQDKTVTGSHQIQLVCDCLFADVDFDTLEMILLPGGLPGTTRLQENKALCDRISEFHKKGKYLAAICAAPSIFGRLGLLEERQYTCFPDFAQGDFGGLYTAKKVEKDGPIITAKGLGAVFEFSACIIETFKGADAAEEVLNQIHFNFY